MSRVIDAEFACKGCVRYGTSLSCEECVVNDAPTVDAVPVVRCRECKHYDGKWLCKISGVPSRKPDDFCSYGERKGDAD